ncbi:MAG TPA: 30S ribosome-binding factor RbfA [Patescibacteria group bacterium]|nr:30S ribosome-binding factor RbfA [Patescibacteria group bacterium]
MSYRLEKFTSTLQQALGEILNRDSLNPDFKLVSILRVQLGRDLKKAIVAIACPAGKVDHVLQQLNRSRGFIKRQLDRKMILRHMPELEFVKDTVQELEQQISRLQKEGDHENTHS